MSTVMQDRFAPYITNILEFDAEHWSILVIMDAINVSIRHEQFEQVNNLIIELGLILLRHYEHETAMMDALDYPNITEHTNEHIRLHNRINEISREVIRSYDSVEAKQYVNTTAASDIESIIFNHMTQHDLKLALWITKNKPDLY